MGSFINSAASVNVVLRMYRIRETTQTKTVVCKSCYENGFVLEGCHECGGKGLHKRSFTRWAVQNSAVDIVKIDRDAKTGKLRFWESSCDFFYETTTFEDNKFIADYPYGVHLLSFSREDAQLEADRLNAYLESLAHKGAGSL